MYNLELISAFLVLLVFGMIFSPFVGGCLVLSFILFILGSLVVLFSLNFVWILSAGILFYLLNFAIKYIKWTRLPDFSAYVMKHPNCNTPDGVSCYNCGSERIKHNGIYNHNSRLRYHVCSNCGTILFRFKVL
jgi:hypothetical protein